jgi:hypothetical protein
MTDVASVFEDASAARLAEDVDAGRMAAVQAVRIAMATGRIQGLYMSANKLAQEAGIVCDFNQSRHGANANDEQ